MTAPSTSHIPITLLTGGHVHSPAYPGATAMAVHADTVVWVGIDQVGRNLYGDDARIIDLDGAFVAPAFVDAHVHSTATGLLLDGLDLTDCRDAADCLARVAAHRDERPTDGIVWGHGWDETAWSDPRLPDTTELDHAAGGAAVYLSRIDVHSALASTALRGRCTALSDADGFTAHGPLTRAAHHLVRSSALAALTPAQRSAAQRAHLRHAAAHGVVSVHECAGPLISGVDDLRAVLALGADPALPDVVGYWGEPGAYELVRELGLAGLAGDLFVDGALGSRTAALSRPYEDHHTRGALYLDLDQITTHVVEATRFGVQAGFHAIGDAAIALVTEAFVRAAEILDPVTVASAGHRVEHLEMVDHEQARLLAAAGVRASVQPAFDARWGGPEGMYRQRLGADRARGLNPFATLAAAGMGLAFGSDSPVTPTDPWGAIRAAVDHRTEGSGISPRGAFTAHTRGGWRAAGFDDPRLGTLVPGAPAHYAVWEIDELVEAGAPSAGVRRWSTDPRSRVPALPSLETTPRCLRTVLAGRTIHQAD